MRLENMTPSHVRRAIQLYLERAWPRAAAGGPAVDLEALDRCDTLSGLLARFEGGAGDDQFKRYTLRLGNYRYPFMKFVVQEYLVREEFFFSVDTHDKLDIKPDAPDYSEWEALKEFNRELKQAIEADFNRESLPTNNDLRLLVEELARVEREGEKRARLLLVDDETQVALGLRALLQARGYDVDLAHDGSAVLDRLAADPLPDLVLLDYEMPQLDGEEVLGRMRQDPRLAGVPVLMVTASSIDLARLGEVSGFLRKPYPRQVLFKMIARLLEDGEEETQGPP